MKERILKDGEMMGTQLHRVSCHRKFSSWEKIDNKIRKNANAFGEDKCEMDNEK